MTRGQRVALYVLAAVLGAAHYWIFSYFLRLESTVQRSLWTAASLGFLIVGWVAVAFWASSPLPARIRWRKALRSSVIILAGIGGLLEEGGFRTGAWASIFFAVAVILVSNTFLRSQHVN
jgi:hypothetical protein